MVYNIKQQTAKDGKEENDYKVHTLSEDGNVYKVGFIGESPIIGKTLKIIQKEGNEIDVLIGPSAMYEIIPETITEFDSKGEETEIEVSTGIKEIKVPIIDNFHYIIDYVVLETTV